MKKRILGKGLEVSAIGLGCMGMSFAYHQASEADSLAAIDRALEIGVNFLDTSDMYGPHTNEQLVGKSMKGRRDNFVIATKFGIVRDPSEPKDSMKYVINGKPEYVREAVEGSLKRLGIDVIDLYYQHRVDPNTPIEDTVGTMSRLVEEGKVRYLGLSEASEESIRKANGVHPITALQSEYSLWTRDVEGNGILNACRELGIGFVAYSPIGRGFLSGAIKSPDDLEENDWRRNLPRFQGENFKKNLELVDRVELIAKEKGAAPSQIALAWVLAQGEDIVPIPGTTNPVHIEQNATAANIELNEADLASLDEIFPKDAASGARLPEAAMATVNK